MLLGVFLSEGLVDLWSACPLGREYCPYLLVSLRGLCYGRRRRKTHRCSFCSFLWRWKIFIYKLRFFFLSNLNQYPFCYQVTLFFLPFVHKVSLSKADTLNNALNVTHLGEKQRIKTIKPILVSSVSVKCWKYWTDVSPQEIYNLCSTCETCAEQLFCHVALWRKLWIWKHRHSKQSLCQNKRTYLNLECFLDAKRVTLFILSLYALYIVHKSDI